MKDANPFPFKIGTIAKASDACARFVTPDFLVQVVGHKTVSGKTIPIGRTISGDRNPTGGGWSNVGGAGTEAGFGEGRLDALRIEPILSPTLDPLQRTFL